jgi:hypothetical protein
MAFPITPPPSTTATLVAASSGQWTTTSGTVTPTLPTGWAAGDFAVLMLTEGAITAGTLAPTGWTSVREGDVTVSVNYHTFIAYRSLQAGDTIPAITIAAKGSWVCIAFRPGSGNTLSYETDSDATDLGAGTSITPPAITPTAGFANDVSVLLTTGRATTAAATAVTSVPPTGWTEPTNGDISTAAGTTNALRQVFCEVSYKLIATGTQTPGAITNNASGGASVSATHLIIRETAPSAGVTNFAGWGLRVNL